jgi:hypothetical protein
LVYWIASLSFHLSDAIHIEAGWLYAATNIPLPLLDVTVSWEWDDVFLLEWRDDALKALRLDGYKIDGSV